MSPIAIGLWIIGVVFLVFPPVGVLVIVAGFAVQMRHRSQIVGVKRQRAAAAQQRDERERILAWKSLP